MGEVEGDEGFPSARLGGKEGDEAARDPARPEPGDGSEAGGEAAEVGVIGGGRIAQAGVTGLGGLGVVIEDFLNEDIGIGKLRDGAIEHVTLAAGLGAVEGDPTETVRAGEVALGEGGLAGFVGDGMAKEAAGDGYELGGLGKGGHGMLIPEHLFCVKG